MLGMTTKLNSEDFNFTVAEERTVFNLRTSINKAVSESASPVFSSSSSPRRSHSNDDDIFDNRNQNTDNGNINSRNNNGNNLNYFNSIGKHNNQYDSNSYNVFTPVISATSTSSANANANVSRTGIGYSQSKNNNDYKNNSNDSNDSNNSNNNDNNDDDDDYKYFISPSSSSTSSQQNNQKASRMNMRPLSLSLLLPNSILSPILEIRTAPISPIFSPISVSDAVNFNETSVNSDEVKDGEGERNGREESENGENNGNKRK